MNNLLNADNPKTGKIPLLLYPNPLKGADGKKTYYARIMNRETLNKYDIADDMIAGGCKYSKHEIIEIWDQAEDAMINRLCTGVSVSTKMGSFMPGVTGSFENQMSQFDPKAHTLNVVFRMSSALKEIFAKLTPVIGQGNTRCPVIDDVLDATTGSDSGKLTPGGFLAIKGRNICVAGENDDVGLYFQNTEDVSDVVKLSAAQIGDNISHKVQCVVPSSLKKGSTYKIMIVTQFLAAGGKLKKSSQSGEYPTALTIA